MIVLFIILICFLPLSPLVCPLPFRVARRCGVILCRDTLLAAHPLLPGAPHADPPDTRQRREHAHRYDRRRPSDTVENQTDHSSSHPHPRTRRTRLQRESAALPPNHPRCSTTKSSGRSDNEGKEEEAPQAEHVSRTRCMSAGCVALLRAHLSLSFRSARAGDQPGLLLLQG